MSVRYTHGGDEFIFAEISEDMSLESFFKGMAITRAARARGRRRDRDLPGQRILSGALRPRSHRARRAAGLLRELEDGIDMANLSLDTRIIEIPVYYNDPWTHETLMRFRERHQDPASTDLEYAARINGFASVQAFIDAHAGSPWFVSMVGFVAGLPFMFQMVERERQLQVPKYLRPRTDTPRHTVGHGGCFGCIYSVRGAGGYQMFGVTPAPIFEPGQRLAHLRDSMVFFRPGDIVKFKPINREEYDRAEAQVEDGSFALRIRPVSSRSRNSCGRRNRATPACWRRYMADASHIEVLKPGLATSVQDKGRQGYYHLGIPPSGALDHALAAANLLVGNAEDAAVLECTLLGPELLFHRAALIAVTGATMAPKIDGKPMPCNMALAVPAGSRLSFEFVSAGARACLAVAGGIDVPVVLGSRSTYTLGAIGGHEGRRLKAGDKLAIGQPRARGPGANCP